MESSHNFPEGTRDLTEIAHEMLNSHATEIQYAVEVLQLIQAEKPELLEKSEFVKDFADRLEREVEGFSELRSIFEARIMEEKGEFTPESLFDPEWRSDKPAE